MVDKGPQTLSLSVCLLGSQLVACCFADAPFIALGVALLVPLFWVEFGKHASTLS